jgi:hypothetical protein
MNAWELSQWNFFHIPGVNTSSKFEYRCIILLVAVFGYEPWPFGIKG